MKLAPWNKPESDENSVAAEKHDIEKSNKENFDHMRSWQTGRNACETFRDYRVQLYCNTFPEGGQIMYVLEVFAIAHMENRER